MSDPAPGALLERPEHPVRTKARHAARRRVSDRWYFTVVVAGVYLLVSALANYDAWAHGVTHTIQTAGGADTPEEIWFLAQTPWAIVHGHNPFSNSWLNAPYGLDLMDNTTMPFLGVLGAPITFLLGPIATFNILLDLALAGSAMAFYFMARRFVRWRPAAFVGGLVYGFSPFASAEAVGHLFLVANIAPPLVVLLLDRFLRTKSDPPWLTGILVGGCFAAQFYISTELFASMVVMLLVAGIVGAVYWLVRRPAVDVTGLAKVGAGAVAVIALLGSYGAWMALQGPRHVQGPEQSSTAIAGISSDPVGLVVPTLTQRFNFGEAKYGDSLVAQRSASWHVVVETTQENGTYVGVPLLLILIAGTVALRKRRLVLFSAAMAGAGMLLSMGSYLHVAGARTAVPLPFYVLAHLPLLNSSEAARYVLFFWLFAALLLALILDAVYQHVDERDRPAHRRRATAACALLALCALIPLVPAWPYKSAPAYVPSWFTTAARSLPEGTTVVVYPFANPADPAAMTWQAMADLTFRMPGGYAVFEGSAGRASFNSAPSALASAFTACVAGADPRLRPQTVRSELRRWHATQVAVVSAYAGSGCAAHIVTSAYGPPRRQGGVLLWGTDAGS